MKRPGVDEFLHAVSKWYELVIFTASMPVYGNPVISRLDPEHLIRYRVFRNNCTFMGNGFAKDLSKLGRDLKDTIIIDNCPLSYAMQPNNAIPIVTWFDDKSDTQLYDLLPVLELLAKVKDVRESLKKIVKNYSVSRDALAILKKEIQDQAPIEPEEPPNNWKIEEKQISNFSERPTQLPQRQPNNYTNDKPTQIRPTYEYFRPPPMKDSNKFTETKYPSSNSYNTVAASNDRNTP